MIVPDSPVPFFTEYIPARFQAVKSGLAGRSSAGCMTFRIVEGPAFSFRLKDGDLVVTEGMDDDVIVQVGCAEPDFQPIFVQGAQQQGELTLRPDQQLMAFKALTIDAERARLVRGVAGTVAFVIADGGATRFVYATPGAAAPKATPDCRLECAMLDFLDLQAGKANPMQLMMQGKIKIVGNAQIPMALSSVFA